ncbi:ATP-binding Cassette (ABC) Superfamily [Thraustotheca clavata]|uniref:ATP-binding Cassette (ABC) Superfamily n=1 Tax=Thraustotheca clavata TaxID=74557 RepID=A0A1W0AAW2_9STRA|nr:ATP-binding Cassette (ABC) Superfamily [Thraustotheca clavata]
MLPDYCGAIDCLSTIASDGMAFLFLCACMYGMYVSTRVPLQKYMEQPCLLLKYTLAIGLIFAHCVVLGLKYLSDERLTAAEMLGTTIRSIAYLFYSALLLEHPCREFKLIRGACFGMAIVAFWQTNELLNAHPKYEHLKLGLQIGTIVLSGLVLLPSRQLQRSSSPFDNANWVSRLTFTYVAPLIEINRPFCNQDIPPLPYEDSTKRNGHFFQRACIEERKLNSPSLFHILRQLYWRDTAALFLWSIGNTLLHLMSPLLTKGLLEWSSAPKPSPAVGYLLASAIFLHAILCAVSISQFKLSKDRFNLRLSSGLLSGVYSRLLELRAMENTSTEIGFVTNLLTMDVPFVVQLPSSLFEVALVPLQITMALAVLGREIAFAFVGGLVLLAIMVPLQVYLAHLVQKIKPKLLFFRDERLAWSVKVFSNIRILKCFVWTEYFNTLLQQLRANELQQLRLRQYITAFCDVLSTIAPILVQTSVFVVIVYTGQGITAARAYTIISLLQQLIRPITNLPWITRSIAEAYVSYQRIGNFIFNPLPKVSVEPSSVNTFAWTRPSSMEISSYEPLLSNPSFEINIPKIANDRIVVVSGPCGAGKSSYLLALLGEMPLIAGKPFESFTSIAYAPQTPWIIPTSIRRNITLEKCDYLHDSSLYWKVLDVCRLGLKDDLIVSEDGANLSGGQRARIGLARALYQRASLYLLDDCWSGLDRQTSKHIFQTLSSVLPELAQVILITQALDLVAPLSPHIILLDKGAIVEEGKFSQLIVSPNSRLKTILDELTPIALPAPLTEQPLTIQSRDDELIEEKRESGLVGLHVWWSYIASVGWFSAIVWPLSCIVLQVLQNGMDYWTAQYITYHKISSNTFANGLLLLSAINTLVAITHSVIVVHGSIRAAKGLYNEMSSSLVNTLPSFYDMTPTGRILNRLGDDTSKVDTSVPMALDVLASMIISIIGSIVVLYFANFYVLILLLPLSITYIRLQRVYRSPARDLARLNHVMQSPLLMHVKSTMEGLYNIRARRQTYEWYESFIEHLNHFQQVSLAQSLTLYWFAIRMDALGILVAGFVGFFAAFECTNGRPIPSAYLGLTMMYALPIIRQLKFGLEAFVWVEQSMVSVERVLEYAELPAEEVNTSSELSWIKHGAIHMTNVTLKYNQMTALNQISCTIRPREKIGICGSSGAGKSSFISCLFRTCFFSGRILIDGVDIAEIPLNSLRSSIAYIPQSTLLFDGTIRFNLDPLNLYDDEMVWDALKQCGLLKVVQNFTFGLNQPVGGLLSQGQQQLLAIGRALLKNAKVVCVDEATANLDNDLDRHVRELMVKVFQQATVLTVAHRISTILQNDRVIVLERGRIVEFDTPARLLENQQGYFARMA